MKSVRIPSSQVLEAFVLGLNDKNEDGIVYGDFLLNGVYEKDSINLNFVKDPNRICVELENGDIYVRARMKKLNIQRP